MAESHNSLTESAHGGYHKNYNRLASSHYWPGMSRDRHGPIGLLQPIPIPTRPFEVVSMDFILNSAYSSHVARKSMKPRQLSYSRYALEKRVLERDMSTHGDETCFDNVTPPPSRWANRGPKSRIGNRAKGIHRTRT